MVFYRGDNVCYFITFSVANGVINRSEFVLFYGGVPCGIS